MFAHDSLGIWSYISPFTSKFSVLEILYYEYVLFCTKNLP